MENKNLQERVDETPKRKSKNKIIGLTLAGVLTLGGVIGYGLNNEVRKYNEGMNKLNKFYTTLANSPFDMARIIMNDIKSKDEKSDNPLEYDSNKK